MAESNPVQSVQRSFTVFEALAQYGALGITELSEITGLHKATVFRLLATLSGLNYVQKDPITDKYSLTLRLVSISAQLLNRIDMRALIRPFLEKLSVECGETVHFVKREGNEIVYIDKVESTVNSIQMVSQIGVRLPLYCTGVGKAILSHMDNTTAQEIFKSGKVEQKTSHTITTDTAFISELEATRQRGYAIDNEENEYGVRCIAAAIPDHTGRYEYAFSISAPILRMTAERMDVLAGLVLKTKATILF